MTEKKQQLGHLAWFFAILSGKPLLANPPSLFFFVCVFFFSRVLVDIDLDPVLGVWLGWGLLLFAARELQSTKVGVTP